MVSRPRPGPVRPHPFRPGISSNSDGFDDPTALLNQLDIDEPTPAEAALLNEALERRFQALREPELRLIAQKKLEGYTSQSRSSTSTR